MTAQTLTLADFLAARFDEDEYAYRLVEMGRRIVAPFIRDR